MTRILIGFFFGLMIASVAAQNGVNIMTDVPLSATLNAGVGPDGKMAPIKVDANGHVICSTEQK